MKNRNDLEEIKTDIGFIAEIDQAIHDHDFDKARCMLNDWKNELVELENPTTREGK